MTAAPLEGWRQPVVGVLGGLGPAATAVFLDLLVRATHAPTDQDHLDAFISQHSSTPDRTAAILDPAAPDPGPVIAADARLLQSIGAQILVLPCNTAHHFVREVMSVLADGTAFVSIVDRTADAAARAVRGTDAPVAVFATEGNIRARVYQEALEERGAAQWTPPHDLQTRINTIIYDQVKAGEQVDRSLFEACVAEAVAAGAGTVVLGCTELSVVYDQHGFRGDPRVVDSLTELALATVRTAGKELSAAFSA